LGPGAISGIVIGSLVGVVAVAGVGFFLMGRYKRRGYKPISTTERP
jgi:hypothetical protein